VATISSSPTSMPDDRDDMSLPTGDMAHYIFFQPVVLGLGCRTISFFWRIWEMEPEEQTSEIPGFGVMLYD